MNLLAVTYPVALALLAIHPYWWIPRDAKAISRDGSAQSLTQRFHAQRWRWRFGFVAVVVGLASLPLLADVWRFAASAVGLGVLGGAWFFFVFTPGLNVARKQAYIGKYHVSWAVGASGWDRRLWAWAWRHVGGTGTPLAWPHPATVAEAGKLLRRVLWAVLAGGVLVFAGCLAFVLLA